MYSFEINWDYLDGGPIRCLHCGIRKMGTLLKEDMNGLVGKYKFQM